MMIVCPQCGATADKAAGVVNRSRAQGAPVYCGRRCAGVARQQNKPLDQRRAEKAAYDRGRRAELGETLLADKRAAYHRAVAADPVGQRAKEREQRQRRMPSHLAYCRTPEYRAWKKKYDREHRAKKEYGPYAGAALALQALQEEINTRSTWLERQVAKGTLNKPQQRKRDYGRQSIQETVRGEPEGRAVGHAPVDPERLAPTRRG